jgi:hypothetical protein
MPTRDFDTGRPPPAQEVDPVVFTMFGRDWRCAPMPPADALAVGQQLPAMPEDDSEAAWEDAARVYLTRALAFIGLVVVDRDGWTDALSGSQLDGDTILDLFTWLADQYAERVQQVVAQAIAEERKTAPPAPAVRTTGTTRRTSVDHVRKVAAKLGGEVAD